MRAVVELNRTDPVSRTQSSKLYTPNRVTPNLAKIIP